MGRGTGVNTSGDAADALRRVGGRRRTIRMRVRRVTAPSDRVATVFECASDYYPVLYWERLFCCKGNLLLP